MKPAFSALGLSLLFAAGSIAQTPAFEAADVHVSAPGAKESGGVSANGRLELRGFTMLSLLRQAYGVDSTDKIIGGPAWLDRDRFDIIAKGQPVSSQAGLQGMLQALLVDRFKLKVHKEDRPLPAFALTMAKRGPGLKDSSGSGAPDCKRDTPNGLIHLDCHNISIEELGSRLRQFAPGYFNAPVIDRTGLAGKFDLQLSWTGRGALSKTGDPAANINLFSYLEKELGIKAEQITQPASVVIIDSVNQTPTENPPGTAELLPPPPTEFEVAEIHPSKPGTQQRGNIVNGRVEAQALPLKFLVAFAYGFESDNDNNVDRVVGEKWTETDPFDLIAKAAPNATEEAMRPMLRKLLEERFKLKVHTEERPVSVFALTKPRATTKLKEADGNARSACKMNVVDGSRNLTCQNATMAQFAESLRPNAGGYLDHDVVDLTGLTGVYDFVVSFIPAGRAFGNGKSGTDASDPSGGMSLFEAIDKQLGLKLAAAKHNMSVIVIDHADRIPSEQ